VRWQKSDSFGFAPTHKADPSQSQKSHLQGGSKLFLKNVRWEKNKNIGSVSVSGQLLSVCNIVSMSVFTCQNGLLFIVSVSWFLAGRCLFTLAPNIIICATPYLPLPSKIPILSQKKVLKYTTHCAKLAQDLNRKSI
jgi:hypothetical protein